MFRGMYKKQRVLSLGDNALKAFGNFLVRTLESFPTIPNEEEIVAPIKSYVESIIGGTSKINEQLLRLINISDMKYDIRLICLQILLNKGVKKLNDSIEVDACGRKFCEIFAKQSGGMQVLNIPNTFLGEESLDVLAELLNKNQDLTQLQLPYICTHKMLEVVGRHCTKLCFLKMNEYYDTNAGVEFLCTSPFATTLTKVELNVTDTHYDHNICLNVAKILKKCPNVEVVMPCSFMGAALEVCQKENKHFKCNLKYVRDWNTSVEKMKIIIETCPKMEHLNLIEPQLGSLRGLNCASLEKFTLKTFNCTELMSWLSVNGHQLKFLSLSEGNTVIDIADIAQFCPNLTSIECEQIKLAIGNESFYFECLEKINFCDSILTDMDFKKLMCSTRILKNLTVDYLKISDRCLADIFSSQNFDQLEVFCLKSAHELTIASVKMLLMSCPNLQKIGEFWQWKVTQADIDSIRCLEKCGKHKFVLNSTMNLPDYIYLRAVTLQDYLTIPNDFFYLRM